MTAMDVGPETRRRRIAPALVLWLFGVVSIVIAEVADRVLDRFDRSIPLIGVAEFFAWLLEIGRASCRERV